MGSVRQFLRLIRASRLAGHGRRSLRGARYEEAKAALLDALALLGPDEPKGPTVGVWVSQRLYALKDLSYATARLGDAQVARASIAEGLALWDKLKLGPVSRFPEIEEWIGWGRSYLASSAGSEVK